ncbi:TetR/AcrR family transcriptional regulator [Mycobacterium sp.]|uniref:TetR/AcrR family transcriptional regulator n=1 Tax=Mycobacterium sp. TaxID=1785 RepID=UPI002D972BF5|nr:helix-turn-helix domain-containing protein [Mycobacterium sp.]
MTAVQPLADGIGAIALSSTERIRDAALKCFATYGASATSLRTVAAAAGVSVGLVQHHFATKAGLVKAVDDHAMAVVIAAVAGPIPEPPADSLDEMGNRVTRMVSEHPDVVDYVGRALLDGSPLGMTIFDTLMDLGIARWKQRDERGETRPDVDLTWAAINSLILALGTMILRTHIERHLPGRLTAPEHLERWQDSVNTTLREGLFRQTGNDGAVSS